MNKKSQLLCIHSAWLVLILMGGGLFGIAGWLPLIPPLMPVDELVQIFEDDRTRIRIGMLSLEAAGALWWPFSAAISAQMRRIEGSETPVMSMVQLAAATGTAMITMLAGLLWLVAAYRPDMPPELLRMLNDFAWLGFVGFYAPIIIQSLAIAVCVLTAEREHSVYPRWLGFANLWCALLFFPGALVPFFYSGPFAWNGIVAFWMVATVFSGWIMMMWWMTTRAINNQRVTCC